jgi:signal transduction histidine kinase
LLAPTYTFGTLMLAGLVGARVGTRGGLFGASRFGIAIAFTLVVPIALFAFFIRTTIDSDISARVKQDREAAAELAANVVRQTLDSDVTALTRFAARKDVVDRARARDVPALQEILSGFVSPSAFKFAGVVDSSGALLARQPAGNVDASFVSDVEKRAAALTSQQSWAFMAPDGRAPTGIATTAVIITRLEVGSDTWAIYGLLDCVPLRSVFTPLPLQSYRAAVLLDARGRAIASADPSGMLGFQACVDFIDWSNVHQYFLDMPSLAQALTSTVGTEMAAVGGTEYIAVHVAVVPGQWVLYLLDSPTEALAGERRLTQQVTIGSGVAIAAAILLAIAFAWLIDRLRKQRTELAHLALTEERLRFARDLHDLLGRGLSIIAMKAELARHHLPTNVSEASTELGDVEVVARQALRDMRDAVVGYRQPSLTMELDGARSVLEAAGIGYRVEQEQAVLPEQIDALFAWTVREGVTNIIRHSGASNCRIRVTRGAREARVEITDDGKGASDGVPGQGLRGVRERAAAQGGVAETGRISGSGFRLAVAVPLSDT